MSDENIKLIIACSSLLLILIIVGIALGVAYSKKNNQTPSP